MKTKVLLITQHYNPINAGAAKRAARFAQFFAKNNYDLTILTGFPSYPLGILPQKYRFKLWVNEREKIGNHFAKIVRTYEYPAPLNSMKKRLINWISFMISATIAVLFSRKSNVVLCHR